MTHDTTALRDAVAYLAAVVILVPLFAKLKLGAVLGYLAAGILIDAFIVRLTLVPALMAVFDDRAWWLPRWLDRLLPDLDIEGDKLLTMLNQETEATGRRAPELTPPGPNGRA